MSRFNDMPPIHACFVRVSHRTRVPPSITHRTRWYDRYLFQTLSLARLVVSKHCLFPVLLLTSDENAEILGPSNQF